VIFYTFESAKQLHAGKRQNTFRCFRDIVSYKHKTQLWIYRIENGKRSVSVALNAFAKEIEIDLRCTRQIFLEHLTTSLRDR